MTGVTPSNRIIEFDGYCPTTVSDGGGLGFALYNPTTSKRSYIRLNTNTSCWYKEYTATSDSSSTIPSCFGKWVHFIITISASSYIFKVLDSEGNIIVNKTMQIPSELATASNIQYEFMGSYTASNRYVKNIKIS